MKTLIITVGTRQIGWRCQDGLVRSLGADGNSNHPSHTEELYTQELGIERSAHDNNDAATGWGTLHLGEQLYQRAEAAQDFSNVVLLLDEAIIEAESNQGLSHIILWGTQQPDTVPWKYRRLDTLWLARLMKGRIRQQWPQLIVEEWCPVVAANNAKAIRQRVDADLLERLLADADGERLTLLVQTKGAAPQVANALDICAAALTRRCTVKQVMPVEPAELFSKTEKGYGANRAIAFQSVSINQYFWPMERSRILSAWQRGDFSEARLWLSAHREQQAALYQLAELLALANNWQLVEALQKVRKHWVGQAGVVRSLTPEQQQQWKGLLDERLPQPETVRSRFLQAWETVWFMELALRRGHTTAALMQFAQTLERLLYLQREKTAKHAGLYVLIDSWRQAKGLAAKEPLVVLLHKIREKRNELVHSGRAVSHEALVRLLRLGPQDDIFDEMVRILTEVCHSSWEIPSQPVLKVLAAWGESGLKK
ncbi:MAG: hypothetical protein AAF050_01195 [Cyanobacteria bacterium J06649_5]